MDFKEKSNDELNDMSVHELAGYYNTLNEVKSAEIDEAINEKSSKKEVAELYNNYKKETEAQVEKLNSILVEQGLKIKKLSEVSKDEIGLVHGTNLKSQLKGKTENLEGLKGNLMEARENEFSIKTATPILNSKAAMSYAGNSAPLGELPQSYREPGVYDERRSILGFLPYVEQTAISSNVVSFVKKKGRKNEAGAVPELEAKPQSEFELVVESKFVVKYANFIKVSTEMLSDISFLEGEINRELIGNLLEKVDKDCFEGGGGSQIEGILQAGNTFGAGSFSGTVVGPNLCDVLVVAMAQMEADYYYKASRVFLNPLDIARLKVTKDTDQNYLNRLMVTADGMSIDGVAISSSTHIQQGTFAICDMSQIRMYVKEDMALEFGMSGNDFIENIRTILTEWRGVLRIVDNNAIIQGSISDAEKELAQIP
jgi:HK97 family phage major capsid protein